MKTKFLFLSLLLFSIPNFAQTDGWRLLTAATTITQIVPDDSNADELHITTDIGYIKYNTTTDLVIDFLNLTSQDPAIGKVNGISLDPTSNDIALALPNGIAVYDGTTVTISNYANSDLTIGETGGSQFIPLEVQYGREGEIYIYKGDIFGYQIFDNGVFDTEVTTTFKPQDVEENLAGTKAYFAGFNTGLHELAKSTSTWTNYTSTNSDLISNPLECLHVDANDLLYIGSFQGLNTLNSSGTWNSYQQLAPPANVFFYPAYDISRNGTTGDVLIRTSNPNTSNFGFSLLDLATNTWTNYRGDGTNCVDNNVFTASTMDSNGSIFVAPQDFSNPGVLTSFNPFTDNCTTLNTNYLNAPVANSSVISDIGIRKRNGNLDIGISKAQELWVYSAADTLGPNGGQFPDPDILTPSPGKNAYSVISDNDYFIVENDDGWVFIDDSNNMTAFSHNIPDYLAINTKKASDFDSESGNINIIHKGFDAPFNYLVYKTPCNTSTATCMQSEEIFTIDRDLSKNILFSAFEDIPNNEVFAVAVKTDGSGSVKRTKEKWSSELNDVSVPVWDEVHPIYPILDVITVALGLGQLISLFVPDINTIQSRSEDINTGDPIITNTTFDENNDGNLDEIKNINSTVITENEAHNIAFAMVAISRLGDQGIILAAMNSNGVFDQKISSKYQQLNTLASAEIKNSLPNDFAVQTFELTQYSPTEALMVILTNYGMLVKSGIDISGLSLDVKDIKGNLLSTTLYPNPTKDIATFSGNRIIKTEVFDLNGRKVLNTETNSISIKKLSKGIYIVKGNTTENISITKKLIKN